MSSEPIRVQINDKLVDIADLKVADLKVELKKRGVTTSGNKHELYERLKNVSRPRPVTRQCPVLRDFDANSVCSVSVHTYE